MRSAAFPSALALLTVLVCVMACGGAKPAEAPSAPSAMQSPPVASSVSAIAPASSSATTASESPGASAAPAASAPAPLATVLTSDASTVQKLFDNTSQAPAATLKDKDSAGRDPLAPGLKEVARKAAPGMIADGPLATGNLKEKQNLQTDVTLLPGKCYAVVGYSKRVKDLDLYLLLPPGILSGQDTTDDNAPVIGGPPQPMCPVATTPITYKLGIVADQGAGEFAVQLYSRAQ
jgi:hypothetical protein